MKLNKERLYKESALSLFNTKQHAIENTSVSYLINHTKDNILINPLSITNYYIEHLLPKIDHKLTISNLMKLLYITHSYLLVKTNYIVNEVFQAWNVPSSVRVYYRIRNQMNNVTKPINFIEELPQDLNELFEILEMVLSTTIPLFNKSGDISLIEMNDADGPYNEVYNSLVSNPISNRSIFNYYKKIYK